MLNRHFVGLALVLCTGVISGMLSAAGRPAAAAETDPGILDFQDPAGQERTLDVNGPLDLDNPFFQDLGTNGRRCVTCHQPAAAWTITPANVQERFEESRGTDPIFTNNDGSNCEGAVSHSLAEKRAAYGLLLTRGLIRVGLDLRPGAEFFIESVRDPNHCRSATNDASLYRRPLPSTNLRFLSAVMWDGRESSSGTTILEDLTHQANDATLGHAQAAHDLTDEQAQQIVAFETGLFTAQVRDRLAGSLHSDGALGGPRELSRQSFFIGINDPVGLNPSGASFDPNVFTLFAAWGDLEASRLDHETEARRAIARGEQLFNTKPITISGVAGLNGVTFASGVTVPDSFTGSCTVCHDSPNVGDHSVKAPLNIGLTTQAQAPYLPVYTLRNMSTQETVQTTDPGRAMITGKWADIGKFKGPILRALAARAPYFHNGSAETLEEVVEFYEKRFTIGLTAREKADLVAFLRAL
jgi:cytochrome c peroxidase